MEPLEEDGVSLLTAADGSSAVYAAYFLRLLGGGRRFLKRFEGGAGSQTGTGTSGLTSSPTA